MTGARASPAAPRAGAAPAGHDRLVVAVRPGDALGFRLAGAEVREVAPGDEGAALRALLADPAAGVVAVEGAVLAAAPQALLERARRRGVPVLLPFDLPRAWGEPGRGEAWVAALVRRAVGYGVKLGGAGGGP